MNIRHDKYMASVVNYAINIADTNRVGACRYMAERDVPQDVIIRVLSHPEKRR